MTTRMEETVKLVNGEIVWETNRIPDFIHQHGLRFLWTTEGMDDGYYTASLVAKTGGHMFGLDWLRPFDAH